MIGGIRGSLGLVDDRSLRGVRRDVGLERRLRRGDRQTDHSVAEEERLRRPTFSVSLVTATGVIDVIIPPSIPMIIYGIAAQQSVPQLFLAGFVPGILIGIALAVYVYIYARRKEHPDHDAATVA